MRGVEWHSGGLEGGAVSRPKCLSVVPARFACGDTAAQSLDIQDALPLVPLRSNASGPRRLLICGVCFMARVLSETSAKGLPLIRGSLEGQIGVEPGSIRACRADRLIFISAP